MEEMSMERIRREEEKRGSVKGAYKDDDAKKEKRRKWKNKARH